MTFEPPLGDLSNQQDWGFRAGAALECCLAHFGVFPPGTAWEFAWDLTPNFKCWKTPHSIRPLKR